MCDDGHEEIVFETLGEFCPMCELIDRGYSQENIDELRASKETQIAELEEKVCILERKLEQ